MGLHSSEENDDRGTRNCNRARTRDLRMLYCMEFQTCGSSTSAAILHPLILYLGLQPFHTATLQCHNLLGPTYMYIFHSSMYIPRHTEQECITDKNQEG